MNHAANRVLRDRIRSNRAAARIRRRGAGSIATHCIAAGLRPGEARSVASTLRKHVAKAGVTGVAGTAYNGRVPAHPCTRFTRSQIGRLAASYRPRKAAYKAARAVLISA